MSSNVRRMVVGAAAGATGFVAGRRLRHARKVGLADELRATVARLDTLLARSPAAYGFFDLDGTVMRVNAPFAALFGYAPSDLTGRRVGDALPNIWARVEPLFERVRDTGTPIVDLEVSGRTRAEPNYEHHWLLSIFPVRADDDALEGMGALILDITERKRSEQEIELLAAASNLFALDLPFDDALEEVARLAIPTFADACIVHLPDRGYRERRGIVAHRDPEAETRLRALFARLPARRPDDPASKVMRDRQVDFAPRLTDDVRRARAIDDVHLEYFQELAGRSAITVPLALGERTLGAATFLFTTASDRAYRPDDVEVARELGRRLAQYLETVRLADEAARATARLRLLARVGELLTIELDVPRRLRRIAQLMLPEFADGSGVYLLEEGRLRLVAAGHPDAAVQAHLEHAELPAHALDEDLPQCTAVRTRQPVLVPELPEAVADAIAGGVQARPGTRDRRPLRSFIAVPLLGENGPIGALGLGYSGSRRYDSTDVPIAVELARRVAPAVENARRYEGDREVIEVLQRTLLPAALPEVPNISIAGRYRPGVAGLRIGGDWYDAVVLHDDRLFLAIGDVVGHGVRAASSMGALRNALQIYASESESPGEMLTSLNRHFSAFSDADIATVGVVVFDPHTGEARVASAGHLPPLVRRPDGTVEYLDPPRGMPICAVHRTKYEEGLTKIAPGTTLVLYTDGLVERRNESLDLGLERLAAAVTNAPNDVERLADDLIETLVEPTDRSDDVALLVVQFHADLSAFSLRLGAQPRELGRLRRAAAEWATNAGATPAERDDIVLALNEAAANAVEHAYAPDDERIEITGTANSAGLLELRVRDFGRWRPGRTWSGGGRGLALIQHLMDTVAVDTTSTGTTILMTRQLMAGRQARP